MRQPNQHVSGRPAIYEPNAEKSLAGHPCLTNWRQRKSEVFIFPMPVDVVMEAIVETKASGILQFIHGLRGQLHVTWEEGLGRLGSPICSSPRVSFGPPRLF
jgi:hypothetical protein